MQLSICIPTYNRHNELKNCLESIYQSYLKFKKIKFEICISDNSENNKNKLVISFFRKKFKKKIKIKYNKFKNNKGVTINFLKSVSMAQADYVWTLGDDDMLTRDALKTISKLLIKKKGRIDYYFINSYNLKFNNLKDNEKLNFNTLKNKLEPFSKLKKSKELNFFELVDPRVTYDFLMAIYFSMFRRDKWNENVKILNKNLIKDKRWISNFDNTFFNQIIFAEAFKNSRAYFQSKPLSINLSDTRDWKSMYCFLEIIRYPEILDYYRKKGLGFFRYLYCKNYSLRNFANYIFKIFINRKNNSGWEYVSVKKHIIVNLIFPNALLSIFYFLTRKLFNLKSRN